jgi:hypothetical protein
VTDTVASKDATAGEAPGHYRQPGQVPRTGGGGARACDLEQNRSATFPWPPILSPGKCHPCGLRAEPEAAGSTTVSSGPAPSGQ